MNNREVCEYIQTITPYNNGEKFIADTCVDKGYGQTCGGYITSNSKAMTQQEHFLYYYGSERKAECKPSYQYLRCPQLLLYVAEIAGIPQKKLKNAYEIIKNYETDNKIHNTNKHGNYLWGKSEFKAFKIELRITAIVRIIKDAKSWDEVIKQTREL